MSALSLKPRMSEKAYASSQNLQTYVFVVPTAANKAQVASAVAEQFKVTVEDVRLVLMKGKVKNSYRKRSRPVAGQRPTIKKAYVRIKAGENIPIFEALEEPKETVVQKAVKKANEKAAEKADKGDKPGRLRSALGRTPRQTQSKGSGGK